jgi:predicted phosphate transport protein (TIGR00153 family)
MLMKLFHALMPKEEKFLDYFCAHSDKIVAATEALRQMMHSEGDPAPFCQAIYAQEGEADAITRSTLLAIHRSFITPFDRADIHGLISAMDDTIDLIEETAQRVELYGVTEFAEQMKEMADSARKCAEIIQQTMPLLATINKNSTRISAHCVAVSKIEGQADRQMRQGLSELIKSGQDPILIITRKEIYELLESVIDRCEDVMDAVQGIVIEHV